MTWHFRFGYVFGNNRANVLEGSDWAEFIFGFGGADEIYGKGGNDRVFAGRGNDWIHAGTGNDFVDGGRGFDTAAFDGSIFDYDINLHCNWFSTTAIVTRFGDDGRPLEVDYLKRVEALYFEDEDYTLYIDGRNNQVLALDDAAATDEDTALTISAEDLLANDTDFDGDTLTVTAVDVLSDLGAVISFVDGQVTYNPAGQFETLKEGETVTDTFSYTVDDGNGGTTTATVTVTITGKNDAPALCQTSVVAFSENSDAVVSVAEAHDVEGDDVTFSISGGDDAAEFEIDPITGELRFVTAPDFENPEDTDSDNIYRVTISASDGSGGVTTKDVSIYVKDVAEAAPGTIIAYDMLGSQSQNLVSFTTDAPQFSSAGDGFGKYTVGDSIPFAIVDDSGGSFPTDTLGIIDSTANTDEFFGLVDTQNSDNDGPLNAVWVFDIEGYENLSLSIDAGAMGDFESSDTITLTYSIDGGAELELFSFSADEDTSQTYTLAGGTAFTLDDPLVETTTATVLSNVLQTLTKSLEGSGSELTIKLTGTADGGSEAFAVQNLVIEASEASERVVVAFDMVGSTSQNLISFTNNSPAFSSAGDGFGKYTVGDSIPFSIVDDSGGSFPADTLGIIDSATNTDEFFGATDTVNSDNSDPVTATWVFDISGFYNLSVALDAGAMGDFESSDSFTMTYSIDGGQEQTLFSFEADEDATLDYTLAGGAVVTLNDPLVEITTGTVLSNALQTLTQSITGSGSQLEITFTADTDGGSEAFAFQNLVIEGEVDATSTGEPSYSVTAQDAEIFEGDSGSTTVTFEIARSGDASEAGSVAYQVIGDLDADDFAGGDLSGVLDFAAGETTKTITLEVAGDLLDECDETLAVTLTDPVNGTIVDQIATTIVQNEDDITLISEIQGEGAASLLLGQYVIVSAVVTYTTSNGFFLQEEDADADDNGLTSEGIFVFTGSESTVQAGDLVKVGGLVDEYNTLTQIDTVDYLSVLATGTTLPTAASIQLSTIATNFEQHEGMRISVTSGIEDEELTIIENFNFDRYGDISVSAGTQTQATQLYDAQTEAEEVAAVIEGNQNNRIVITDGSTQQNPDSYGYVANTSDGDDGDGVLSSGDDFTAEGPTLRLGAEIVSPIEGVLTVEQVSSFTDPEYKVLVDGTLDIDETTNSGAREETPADVGGDIQVASFNVLNYFTTFSGGTGPDGSLDPRGADNQSEFDRQTAKIVEAMIETGAEVFALQEIENNGFNDASAIDALVDVLNAKAVAEGTGAVYAYVNPLGVDGFLGTDAIMTGMIYDTTKLTLVYADSLVFEEASAADTYAIAEVLNSYVSSGDQVGDFQRNRPATVATFQDENGEIFTVASNHFKSKGDSNLQDLAESVQSLLDAGSIPADEVATVEAVLAALIADPNFDQGNGQGFWNQVRTDAATELVSWLEGDYADALSGLGISDADYLVMGDFNAYAEEDPVQAVRDDAAYVDLIDQFIGQEDAYSFVFDGQQGTLDQALASEGMASQVTGLAEWHINADEPDLLNYDDSFTDSGFYNEDVFASSDHDPVIVGLDLGSQNDNLLA